MEESESVSPLILCTKEDVRLSETEDITLDITEVRLVPILEIYLENNASICLVSTTFEIVSDRSV